MLEGPQQATAATTGVRYPSFLFQSGQETGATTYQTLALYNTSTLDANRTFDIGLTNNGGLTGTAYGFGASGIYSSTGVAANASVHLMVVKFNFSTDLFTDTVTVWMDPAPGAGDSAGGLGGFGLGTA